MVFPRIRYQTIEFGEIDIHLRTLRDKNQFADAAGVAEALGISSALWPIFGVVWPSSLVMSHFLLDFEFEGKRILEIGCGIGLSSLLLNHLHADITATDYHPEVEGFLTKNTRLNKDRDIPFELADWHDLDAKLGLFDLIIGSDLLYEDEHAQLLSRFIAHHAKPDCEVILVDPGRGRHGKFTQLMAAEGYQCVRTRPENEDFLEQPFKGWILAYTR